jgi:hypothetical protein
MTWRLYPRFHIKESFVFLWVNFLRRKRSGIASDAINEQLVVYQGMEIKKKAADIGTKGSLLPPMLD